jgi:hypothetical protein
MSAKPPPEGSSRREPTPDPSSSPWRGRGQGSHLWIGIFAIASIAMLLPVALPSATAQSAIGPVAAPTVGAAPLVYAGLPGALGGPSGPVASAAAGPQWHHLTNLTNSPSARDRFGMAYDPRSNETVLFGGYNPGSTSVIFGDTWVFRAGAWTQLSLHRAPAPRSGFVLAYDPLLGGIVLFGGEDFSIHYGDTWLFNGTAWRQLSTPTHPSDRSQYAMAYDAADRELVMFGGTTDGTHDLGDTWALNATGWHAVVSTPSPQARQFSEMAYDGQDREVVLAGGLNATSGAVNGTWAFHAGAWTKLTIHPTPPSEVQSMATTLGNGAALFFGGQASGGTTFTNATWIFHHGNWTHTGYPFVPSPRKAGGFAYDSATGAVLMFGGAATNTWLGDTWELY